jgi:hypothetical protein
MANNNNTYEQVYNVAEDESLLSRVVIVICTLVPRGLIIAGYTANKELLTIHTITYNKNQPVWALDFYEHLFANEPLLAGRDKVKAVFICTNKQLVVPDDLYDETEAKKWLKHIHFIEATDVITSYHLPSDTANYLFATPVNITELIKINFKKAALMPLAAYQFNNLQQKSLFMQCCITNEQASITLYNYTQLLWHRIMDYTCAEDIAFEIKHMCVEANISPAKVSLVCNTISAAEFPVLTQLSQYIPGIKNGKGNSIGGKWDAAISLAQQLIACVS